MKDERERKPLVQLTEEDVEMRHKWYDQLVRDLDDVNVSNLEGAIIAITRAELYKLYWWGYIRTKYGLFEQNSLEFDEETRSVYEITKQEASL